jgi:hypothetical protein
MELNYGRIIALDNEVVSSVSWGNLVYQIGPEKPVYVTLVGYDWRANNKAAYFVLEFSPDCATPPATLSLFNRIPVSTTFH